MSSMCFFQLDIPDNRKYLPYIFLICKKSDSKFKKNISYFIPNSGKIHFINILLLITTVSKDETQYYKRHK